MNEPFGEDKAPPAVSVVIVAYNSGATLDRCVSALAAQTFAERLVHARDRSNNDS